MPGVWCLLEVRKQGGNRCRVLEMVQNSGNTFQRTWAMTTPWVILNELGSEAAEAE
jgi:hypothetical protein